MQAAGQSLDARAFEHAVRSFPTLRGLGLGDAELNALRSQGYLTQDDRGHGHAGYWRLRFRVGDKVRTIYLGRDGNLVECAQTELAALQREVRETRRITEVTWETKMALRIAKKRLEPALGALGFHFHGSAIRKSRRDK